MPNQPLPITVITGFLGSGKTTLIRNLLTAPHGLRIALVLNEIGQAGIDQVPEADQAYLELTEGCACCVRNPDLIAALQEICQRTDIDRIVFETSGLADPLPLTWSLTHPELREAVRLDSVVVVLDARHHEAASREEWEAQVRGADFAVVSKQDLVPPETAELARQAASAINPQLRFLEADDSLASELLLDVDIGSPRALSLERAAHHHSDFGGFIIAGPERYRLTPLEDLLEAMPPAVFRAKGIVPVDSGGWVAFQVVGGRSHVELEVPPPSHGEGRIALFGRSLDEAPLRALFEACR
jgi:G3E family GTPase